MRVAHEGTTTDGREYVLRYPMLDDVDSATEYVNRLSQERTFVTYQGETVTREEEVRFIEGWLQKIGERNGVFLFLIVDGIVQGACGIETKRLSERHVATLGLSIDASMRGQGLGKLLMETTIEEAIRHIDGLRIITLTVKEPNERAQGLYTKLGFKEFGRLPGGTRQNGEFVDEIYMYKNVI